MAANARVEASSVLIDMIALACATAGRNLSWDEWEQARATREYDKTCKDLPVSPSLIVSGRLGRFMQDECGRLSLSRKRVDMRKRAQVEIIRVEIVRPLASGPFHFRAPQAGFDRTDDTADNPVLKIEDILERPVEFTRP